MQKLVINAMIDFLLYEKGESFNLNGNSCRALFEEVDYKIQYYDDKIMITKFMVVTGSIIEHQFNNWFVISQVSNNNSDDSRIFKARIRKVEQSFKKYIDGVLQEIPCIIDCGNQGVQTNQNFSVVDGNIKLTVQDNDITQKITYNDTFIKMGAKWIVTAFSTESLGLRHLYCKKTEFSNLDDKVNEIAAANNTNLPSETITNGITLQLTQSDGTYTNTCGYTKKCTAKVYDNGVEVTGRTFAYSFTPQTVAETRKTVVETNDSTGISIKAGSTAGAIYSVTAICNEDITLT